jgi:ABC-type multidrug transport system ATPase subunit
MAIVVLSASDFQGLPIRVAYTDLCVSVNDESVAPWCGLRARDRIDVLDGISGVLEPGTLTLVLGPPGSGSTII